MSKRLIGFMQRRGVLRSSDWCAGFVLACTVLAAPSFAQNLITNGGFENGFIGWTVAWPPPIGTFLGVGGSVVHSGSFSAYFGATGSADDSIMQSVPTVPNQPYQVQFWLDHSDTDSQNDFSASWNGSPLLSLQNASSFGWTEYTYTAMAVSGTSSLQFSGATLRLFSTWMISA